MFAIFRQFSPGIKLLLLFAFCIMGAGLGGSLAVLVGTVFFQIPMSELAAILNNPGLEHAEAIKWINNCTQFGTFLFPVILFAFVFGTSDIGGFRLQRWSWMIFIVPIWIALSGGFIDFFTRINEWLIPEGGTLEKMFKPMEEQANALTSTILADRSPMALVTTLITIVLIPAFSEEWLFRGTLQPLLAKATGRPHQAVWITAFVFSFIHFQFYGFIPRMLLGSMLGYAVLWSGSLWTAIAAHLVNNLLAVVLFSLNGDSLEAPVDSFQNSIYANLASTIVCLGLGYYLWKRRSRESYPIPAQPN